MKTQEQKLRKALRKLDKAMYPDSVSSKDSAELLSWTQVDKLCTNWPELCTAILITKMARFNEK